jgi:hypothetical protein
MLGIGAQGVFEKPVNQPPFSQFGHSVEVSKQLLTYRVWYVLRAYVLNLFCKLFFFFHGGH